MELEKQVVSLELAKRLKALGVKQESLFEWLFYHWPSSKSEGKWEVAGVYENRLPGLSVVSEEVAAFTVAELGLLLPKGYRSYYYDGHPSGGTWMCNDGLNVGEADSPTEADARAAMLVHLIEQRIITEGKRG